MYTLDEKPEAFVAIDDLRLCLNRVVQISSGNFNVVLAGANVGVGVLANAPNVGEQASVITEGITMVRVGAAVLHGAKLSNATSGWAVTAAVTAGLQHVFGVARCDAASGMLCAVKLKEFYLPNSIA